MKIDMNKIWRRWGCLTLSTSHLLVAIITAACFLIYWHLPAWLGEKLLPQVAAACGIYGIKAEVRDLGITGATLERVRMELDGSRVIAADSIQLSYRLPWWPFERQWQINAVTINGARIKVIRDGGNWHIPGIYPKLVQPQPAANADNSSQETKAAFNLRAVTLNRCVIVLEQNKQRLEFPFTVRIKCPEGLEKNITLSTKLQCGNDTIKVKGEIDRRTGQTYFNITGGANLDNYMPFFAGGSSKISGNLDFSGGIFGTIPLGCGRRLDGNIKLQKLNINGSGWNLGNGDNLPVKLKFRLNDNVIDYSADNIVINGAASLAVQKISGVISYDNNGISTQGTINSIVQEQKNQSWSLESALTIAQQYHFNWNMIESSGEWSYTLKTDTVKPFQINFKNGRLSSDILTFTANGKFARNYFKNNYDYIASAELRAGEKVSWQGLPAGLKAGIASPRVTMKIKSDNDGAANYLTLESDALNLPEHKISAAELKFVLPLPGNAEPYRQGVFKLDAVKRNNTMLGELALTISGSGDKLDFAGSIKPEILPGAAWQVNGAIAVVPPYAGTVTLDAGPYRMSKALELGNFLPQFAGLTFNGDLEAHAQYSFSADAKHGKFNLNICNGELTGTDKGIAASGIAAHLTLPRLPEITTLPGQSIQCQTLKIGNLNFSGIELDYQIEPNMAVLLENFSAGWCGGKIYTQALRMMPGQKNFRMVLYADGLKMAQLIEESGLAKASGTGVLHGRFPVSFGVDGITLESGFLYSAPDDKQNIQIAGAEKMIEDIPKESAQYTQMDIAVEALKNFDYEWIKINFGSNHDILKIETQLNGKPALPLPFKYDPQQGGFIRVKGESVVFQGIRLNVNTSLPLNRLLNFNNSIKELTGGKKP
jgi:hypothetical protein